MFGQVDALHSLDPFWIFRFVYDLFTGGINGTVGTATKFQIIISQFFHSLPYYAVNLFAKFAVFSFFISIALAIIVAIYLRKYVMMRKKIISKILPAGGESDGVEDSKKMENPKWLLVEKHINSENPSDWKLAILEADIMLSELLESLALPGESIGEKLKAVEQSDFSSIEQAWEAHKIRNAIAHEGSDFVITERETKRIINLYKKVFDEFQVI